MIAAAMRIAPLSFSDDIEDLLLREPTGGALRLLEDGGDARLGGRMAAPFQPVDDVRPAAQRADRDDLAPAAFAGGHAGVYPVGQPGVALLHRLDDGGGVDARRRLEGVLSRHRIAV